MKQNKLLTTATALVTLTTLTTFSNANYSNEYNLKTYYNSSQNIDLIDTKFISSTSYISEINDKYERLGVKELINFLKSKNCEINECAKVSFDGEEEEIFIDVSFPYKEYSEKLALLDELDKKFNIYDSDIDINITQV